MFGYLSLSTSITKEEAKKYRAYYCGLCHVLKEKYGKDGTINLSYDMTFLTLLLSDLYDAEVTSGKERCAIHPVKEHDYSYTIYTSYAADMQMILSYYSALDDVKDEGKGKGKVKKLSPYMEDLKKKYQRQVDTLEKVLKELDEAEREFSDMPEYLARTFGLSFAEILCPNEEDFFSGKLKALGSSLGRFIYLMDAYDDRKEDARKGLFNPLLSESEDRIRKMLLSAAEDASNAFETLPLDDHIEILRNIIYDGIWLRFEKKEGKEGEK